MANLNARQPFEASAFTPCCSNVLAVSCHNPCPFLLPSHVSLYICAVSLPLSVTSTSRPSLFYLNVRGGAQSRLPSSVRRSRRNTVYTPGSRREEGLVATEFENVRNETQSKSRPQESRHMVPVLQQHGLLLLILVEVHDSDALHIHMRSGRRGPGYSSKSQTPEFTNPTAAPVYFLSTPRKPYPSNTIPNAPRNAAQYSKVRMNISLAATPGHRTITTPPSPSSPA
jgi:hypothetical protein